MRNLFHPLSSTSRRSQEMVEQIEEAIYRGDLTPGDRLPAEHELARRFASSRASVREALRTLEALGLITIRQGATGGCFINQVDHRIVSDSLARAIRLGQVSLDDLTEVRVALEPYVAQLAAERAAANDLERMAEALALAERDLASRRAAKFSHLDFHALVADAAHNPALSIIMHSLKQSLIESFSNVPLGEESMASTIRFHQRIYDAIARRDPEGARKIMFEHVLDMQGWGNQQPPLDVRRSAEDETVTRRRATMGSERVAPARGALRAKEGGS